MEFLQNGYTLETGQDAFPLSTDSIVLAHFVRLPRSARVLDLGAGCGTLGMLLCAADASCAVTGVELDKKAHDIALGNIESNGLQGRLSSICADVRDVDRLVTAGSFDCCVCNPPYFSSGPQSKTLPLARRDDLFGTDDLFSAAEWALRYGGDLFVVHRPERLAELCAKASAHRLEPKRLLLLRHRSDGPVSLIALQYRKGGKVGLLWEEAALYAPDGAPTAYYNKLYHQETED